MKRAIYFNGEYNPKNPTKGGACLVFDDEAGLQIVDNKIKFSNTNIYSAFEVMPNKVTLSADDTYAFEIPACTIHKMTLRSSHEPENCDVVIDWGDGIVEAIKDGNFISHKEGKSYELMHDYAETMSQDVEKFIVKIYGKDYYTFRHNESITTIKDKQSIPSIVETSNNLISRIFDKDLPIAPHICNFASMCYGALRLVNVNIPHSTKYITSGFNFSSMFQYCSNLKSVIGFEDSPVPCGAIVGNMFSYCLKLEKTDFVIPTSATTLNYLFYCCESLTSDIAKLIPANGFALDNINCNLAFSRTSKLTGNIPSKLLWETSKTFDRCSSAFRDSALKDQAPKTWGGTK